MKLRKIGGGEERERQRSICKGMYAGNPDQRAGLGSLRSNEQHHRAFNDKFCHPPCNLVYKYGWGYFSFFPCQWDMQTFFTTLKLSEEKTKRKKKRVRMQIQLCRRLMSSLNSWPLLKYAKKKTMATQFVCSVSVIKLKLEVKLWLYCASCHTPQNQ